MTELELIRAECAVLPGPTDEAMQAARDALRREFVPAGVKATRRRRPRLLVLATFATAVVAAIVALVVSTRSSSIETRVVAAANAALTPGSGEVLHAVSREVTTYRRPGGTTRIVSRTDYWAAAGGSSVARTTYGSSPAIVTFEGPCGTIDYDESQHLFTVNPFSQQQLNASAGRPVRKSGSGVRYLGTTTYHGIPAARLVDRSYGSTLTSIVRRDNGYPLEDIDLRVVGTLTLVLTTTYSVWQHLPGTPANLRRAELTPHHGAFVLRTAVALASGPCSMFGSYASLTERSLQP